MFVKGILNRKSVWQIREDSKKGVYVENLKETEVTYAREVIQLLIQVRNTTFSFLIFVFLTYCTDFF